MAWIEKPPVESTEEAFDDSAALAFWAKERDWLQKHFNDPYEYWTKVKAVSKANHLDPSLVWRALQLSRFYDRINLEFTDKFSFNIPDSMQRMLHFLTMHCGGTLQSVTSLPLTNKEQHKFIMSSLITEAYSSSVLEGAVSTHERAKELINSTKPARNLSEKMIVNNYQAMQFIRANKDNPLDMAKLLELHIILTKETLDHDKSGRFRNEAEHVDVIDALNGDVIYTPPLAKEVPVRMRHLIAYFNFKDEGSVSAALKVGPGKFVDPILRAAILHFMIGYIHPFCDGNGRLARALFYWHMLANGFWMAEYLSISRVILKRRNQYYIAFQQVEKDSNNLTYFLQYHIKAIGEAFEELLAYIDKKIRQQSHDIIDMATSLQITPRQAEILQIVQTSKAVWTAHQFQNRLQISLNTARADLNALTDKGLLERFNLDKKTQAWRLV